MAGARAADENIICRTSQMPMMTFQELFSQNRPLRVPTLQRRYCWTDAQFERLLGDVVRIAIETGGDRDILIGYAVSGKRHSLGRVLVSETVTKDGSFLLLDGQQRITTASILFSAIRDTILRKIEAERFSCDAEEVASATSLCEEIGHYIFLPIDAPSISPRNQASIAILCPTFFDRVAYLHVSGAARYAGNERVEIASIVSNACPEATQALSSLMTYSGGGERITRAKQYFDGALPEAIARILAPQHPATGSSSRLDSNAASLSDTVNACGKLTRALAYGFSLLWFLDGGADAFTVYERLAFRDAALAAMANARPGVSLAEADLVRNYLLSFFSTESAQLQVYAEYWAPIELRYSAADQEGHATGLDDFFKRFLQAEGPVVKKPNIGAMGGAAHLSGPFFPTYRAIRAYVEGRLSHADVPLADACSSKGEAVVRAVMERMMVCYVHFYKQ